MIDKSAQLGISIGLMIIGGLNVLGQPTNFISPLASANFNPPPLESSPSPKPDLFGKASWYGESDEECVGCSANRRMANGETFDENRFTSACASDWELGQKLIVSYGDNSVEVTCTDRGGFEKIYGRKLDLSKAAFKELANTSKGIIKVKIEEVE